MQIKKIYIDNYKKFQDFELVLPEGVCIINGCNGTCKTALMEILYELKRFLAMPSCSDTTSIPVEEAFPFSVLPKWKIKKTGSIDLHVAVHFDENYDEEICHYVYDLVVRYNFLNREQRVQSESLSLNGISLVSFDEGNMLISTDDNKEISFGADWRSSGVVVASRNNSKIRIFGEALSKLFCLQYVPQKEPEIFNGTTETLNFDGSNFTQWRSYNANTFSEKIHPLGEYCKDFIPDFISLNDVKQGDGNMLKLRLPTGKSAETYDVAFHELSDGQQKLIVLYSLLVFVPPRSVVCIDEPENFLSPEEIQPWLYMMNDIWEEKDIQIIAISHNAKTLNWYNAQKVTFCQEGIPPRIYISRQDESGC